MRLQTADFVKVINHIRKNFLPDSRWLLPCVNWFEKKTISLKTIKIEVNICILLTCKVDLPRVTKETHMMCILVIDDIYTTTKISYNTYEDLFAVKIINKKTDQENGDRLKLGDHFQVMENRIHLYDQKQEWIDSVQRMKVIDMFKKMALIR